MGTGIDINHLMDLEAVLQHRWLIGGVYTEKLMVALRDGRKLIGVLRSWDQFGMFRKCVLYPHCLDCQYWARTSVLHVICMNANQS